MSSFGKDEQFLKSNAAAMRALAGGKEHQVTYAGTDTHVGKDDVRLPALPPTATAAQKASLRGAADGAARDADAGWQSWLDPPRGGWWRVEGDVRRVVGPPFVS